MGGANPLSGGNTPLLKGSINVTRGELQRHDAQLTDDLSSKTADAEFQSRKVRDPFYLFSEPAPHLATGIAHGDAIAIEAREDLLQQRVTAALCEPRFHLPCI